MIGTILFLFPRSLRLFGRTDPCKHRIDGRKGRLHRVSAGSHPDVSEISPAEATAETKPMVKADVIRV